MPIWIKTEYTGHNPAAPDWSRVLNSALYPLAALDLLAAVADPLAAVEPLTAVDLLAAVAVADPLAAVEP